MIDAPLRHPCEDNFVSNSVVARLKCPFQKVNSSELEKIESVLSEDAEKMFTEA